MGVLRLPVFPLILILIGANIIYKVLMAKKM
jgi:hypothetical protein